MSITLVVLYIISLCWGIQPSMISLLGPRIDSPLIEYFTKNNRKIKQFELWRLFTCSLIHGHFSHIFNNLISFLIIGSILEFIILWKQMSLLWLASSIGGTLLSCLCNPRALSLGASGAIYGIFGAYVSV